MTCIVGLVHNKLVYIGGDAAASGNGTVTLRNDPKVIRRGDYIMGFTTSFRMGDILEYRVPAPNKPPKGISLRQYLITNWIDQHLRRVFNALGYLRKDNNADQGGTFLIACGGELCEVYDNFQVGSPRGGYSAVGSGAPYALGALHALYRNRKMSGEDIVRTALEAAAAHNSYVRPPFKILRT